MLGGERHDDHRIFAALAFMDRDGIGKNQFVKVGIFINDLPFLPSFRKPHHQLLLFRIQLDDAAHITVKDHLLVVIPDLHDFIAQAEGLPRRPVPLAGGRGLSASWSRILRWSTPLTDFRIGERTWMSPMGSHFKYLGRRVVARLTISRVIASGSSTLMKKKSVAFLTSGSSPWLIRWALVMILLVSAWRKMVFRRMVGESRRRSSRAEPSPGRPAATGPGPRRGSDGRPGNRF